MSTEGTRQRTSESQCERQDTPTPTKCRIHSGDTGDSCQWLNSLTYLENKGYSVEESFVGWLLKNLFEEGGCSAWSSHSNPLYGGGKGLLSCAGLRGPGFRGIMWGVWACLLHLWDKSNWVGPLPKVAWSLTQLWSPERERLTGHHFDDRARTGLLGLDWPAFLEIIGARHAVGCRVDQMAGACRKEMSPRQ